ncbi:RING finger domain-containing protein [Alternaria rosae]|uniref:RING finger domain-containing protein n=1 Tax=Alternaria rosae TaxID=1187941 RepID=UPI001E8E34AD|nr:RING finger domain-containing protein [Alternaria rosae]KAH6877505.1 RING finger domain-containing protein [Alternaria rosae]
MGEGEGAGGVQGDLEKELTCSICTDVLFQPLTLLDCLHTFCGACLKEWFAFQASTATSIHPYTCPSCRASVRTTQPNATVTTLLDIFLKANPQSGKSAQEKQADRDRYRPGDNVLPKLRRRDERDDTHQRMLEAAQQPSLRDAGTANSSRTSLDPPRERTTRERSRNRSRESRRARDQRRSASQNPPGASPSRAVIPPRAIEHQSSLRSLLSASDLDAEDVDEDLVRQVLEELVSEGVDLNQIGTAQEEEITERIAEAVRRRQAERHAERQRERRERRERLAREGLTSASSASLLPQAMRSPLTRDEEAARRRRHGRSESGASTPQTAVGPPISRPALIDAANRGGRAPRQRSSSQGSSRSATRVERPAPGSAPANTASGDRHSSSESARPRPRRQSDNQQRNRLDVREQFRISLHANNNNTLSSPSSPQSLGFDLPNSGSPTTSLATVGTAAVPLSSSTPAVTPFQPPSARRTTDPTRAELPRSSHSTTPPLLSPPAFPRSTPDPAVSETQSRQASSSSLGTPVLYTEPHVACQRCGKNDIQYELHYNCRRCDGGEYNLCLRCYRLGRGCKHWYGFGWTAWPRYEREAPEGGYPPHHEHPHILVGHRYRRPMTPLTESTTPPHVLMSEDDPKQRVEIGVFCDVCKAYANACYWKCDYCNDGDWGYCNDCVNQGHHCTHPLVPVARKTRDSQSVTDTSPSAPSTPRQDGHLAPPDLDATPTTPPLTPKSASLMRGPGYFTIANFIFRPLTFTTLCNICSYPIPPSNTRYHCLKCNTGDYDICMSCYQKLVISGRITKEDGVNGWRKCLRSHRMYIVGFEDRDGAQRRMVVRDLVGGYALKEEDEMARVQRYPPDGGIGLRLLARWCYLPDEGVEDELSFPRGAEIREAADINGDWYWGVYCGVGKLFPANHVTAV